MTLTLTRLSPDVWHEADVVAAVEAGRLDRLVLAYRGWHPPRCSQDDVARLLGVNQGTVSRIEHGKVSATPQRVDAVLSALSMPYDLRRRWGGW